MKTLLKLMSAVLCIFLLASCGQKEPVEESASPTGIDCVYPATPIYSSIEEFIEAIQKAVESYDPEHLTALDEFPLPASLPEEYKAYRVFAEADRLELWYLPEDRLVLNHLTIEAEQRMQHFYFAYYRTGSLDELVKKTGNPNVSLVDDKFYVVGKNGCGIYWEEDGHPLVLYIPKAMEFSEGNIITRFNGEINIVASIEEICSTEKITITK